MSLALEIAGGSTDQSIRPILSTLGINYKIKGKQNIVIEGIASIKEAKGTELTFCSSRNEAGISTINNSNAGVILCDSTLEGLPPRKQEQTLIFVDPEIMPRLFTKFATKSIVGTGLGLYISKRIIEAHGGKMWAENNSDGIGTTFSFTLPLVIQEDHKESIVIDTGSTMNNDIEERRKKRSIYYNTHKTKIKRIFLVDDDYDHTITFRLGLELAEFEVDAYNDSAIALSKFKPDYYDLLLIDVKMPKIDGFELYEKLRKIDDKVKVWFITAYETYYRALKEASQGEISSVPVIEKPIEIDKLVKQIKTELGS